MAFLEFPNVRIAGIAAGVPSRVVRNEKVATGNYDAADFVDATGVKERRVGDFTTSDLGLAAAERLIEDLGWDKKEIGALVFVSQTPDYILPATSCTLQNRLGLSRDCFALDISLGCSGWTYGVTTLAGLLSPKGITKALLIAGDAKAGVVLKGGGKKQAAASAPTVSPAVVSPVSPEAAPKVESPAEPKEDASLFGFAATVTAIEFLEGAPGFRSLAGTDGSGYDAIITPGGGARNPFNEHSLEPVMCDDGVMRADVVSRMKGMDVFAFGISVVPKNVKTLLQAHQVDIQSIDYFVFHQANLKLNEQIRKKLKLAPEKVPYCLDTFGNTSSASIPLTIVTRMAEPCRSRNLNILACGFGVGLSWATLLFETDGIVVSELVELS